jgi:multidrug efflux pump subunit AcrB
MIVLFVLIGIIVVLCGVLGLLVGPYLRLCLRRRRSNLLRTFQSKKKVQEHIDQRYMTIDNWLVTKVCLFICVVVVVVVVVECQV